MFKNLEKYKSLGVINRTPNSFSDQGLSLNSEFFDIQLASFLGDESVIIDVGFESTAPMNEAITAEVELERFHSFLEASKKFSFNDRYISFDTYKIENFKYMVYEFKKLHPRSHFIFNDVSGDLSSELKETLFEFRNTSFYYIYTFSHIPERAKTLDHMKYQINHKNIVESTAEHFIEAFEWFKSFRMEHQLILDPGYGFSKTYEQNWKLITEFSSLEGLLLKMNNPILIGLSKKSFLKKALPVSGHDNLNDIHYDCLKKIMEKSKKKLLFRLHDTTIIKKLYSLSD